MSRLERLERLLSFFFYLPFMVFFGVGLTVFCVWEMLHDFLIEFVRLVRDD